MAPFNHKGPRRQTYRGQKKENLNYVALMTTTGPFTKWPKYLSNLFSLHSSSLASAILLPHWTAHSFNTPCLIMSPCLCTYWPSAWGACSSEVTSFLTSHSFCLFFNFLSVELYSVYSCDRRCCSTQCEIHLCCWVWHRSFFLWLCSSPLLWLNHNLWVDFPT